MYLVNEDGRVKSVQEEPGWADTKPFSYKEDSSYEKDSSHEEDSRFSASTNNDYDDDDYKNKLCPRRQASKTRLIPFRRMTKALRSKQERGV